MRCLVSGAEVNALSGNRAKPRFFKTDSFPFAIFAPRHFSCAFARPSLACPTPLGRACSHRGPSTPHSPLLPDTPSPAAFQRGSPPGAVPLSSQNGLTATKTTSGRTLSLHRPSQGLQTRCFSSVPCASVLQFLRLAFKRRSSTYRTTKGACQWQTNLTITTVPTSKSSKAWRRSASVRACTLARRVRAGFTTWCTRWWTTPWTRLWRGTAPR